jgi:putative transcriptional regulator
MNNVKAIRDRLGVTQQALAKALDCSQGNIGHIEKGIQEFKPPLAKLLIDFAASLGHQITFDDVYAIRPAAAPAPATATA